MAELLQAFRVRFLGDLAEARTSMRKAKHEPHSYTLTSKRSLDWAAEIGNRDVRMNTERVKNVEEHRGRRGAAFPFGLKGVLVVQNDARRASEQERQSMETERR